MSSAVEMNGATLVPIREAASSVSYSRDYVARLAREGKIVASQIGRQWFVDVDSLRRFASEASALEEVRKAELRAERKRELMAKEALATLDTRVRVTDTKQRFDAFAVAVAVLCLGIVTGLGAYTFSIMPDAKLASLTHSVTETAAPVNDAEVVTTLATEEESPFRLINEADSQATLLLSTVEDRSVFTSEAEVSPIEEGLEGILIFTDQGEVRDEADVAALFSDPVEVAFTSERSGTITLPGETATSTLAYPFVRLPVATEAPATTE